MQIKKVGVRPRDLSDFVDRLQASGQYTFRREEAVSALGVSEIALQSAARRLAAKGRICAPRRGFYDLLEFQLLQHRGHWQGTAPVRRLGGVGGFSCSGAR